MALSINESYNAGFNQVQDNPKSKKEGKAPMTAQEMLEEVLKAYEKAKEAIAGHVSDVAGQDLDSQNMLAALKNNPLWAAFNNPQNQNGTISKDDAKNLFYIIFKSISKNNQSSNADLASKAAHILSDLQLTNEITDGSQLALTKMQSDIEAAIKKEHSPLNEFLKVFIPLILVVITVVVIIATAGSGTGAAAAGDAAAGAAIEGGVEGGAAAATEGASAAAETTTTATAETTEETTQTSFMSRVGANLKNFAAGNMHVTAGQGVLNLIKVAGAGIGGYYAGAEKGTIDNNKSNAEQSEATTVLQGNTSTNSSAVASAQNDISAAQNNVQNENNNIQSAEQIENTIITNVMSKVNTAGAIS